MSKKKWTPELQAKIIAKAWKDENFRKQLLADPKSTLKAFGVDVPSNIDLKILSDDEHHKYSILPHLPSNRKELSMTELENMAAGAQFSSWCAWECQPN